MRKGDPNPIHFSPTDMAKCPIQLDAKKAGKKFVYTEKVREIFKIGNTIHHNEGIYRHGARGHIDTELHMTVIKNTVDMIFSGYADFIMIDEKGLYGEDLKSCDRKAFYHFNSDPESFSEKIQVSSYRWLYFNIFGVDIERWVITKIDRAEPRNRISLLIKTYSIEYMDKFLENHPSIRKSLRLDMTEVQKEKVTDYIIRKNRWVCKYCDDSKTCPLNKRLTTEEKLLKAKKKKGKATFQKLVS